MQISVIIPFYNEEESLKDTLLEVSKFLRAHTVYHFIFVDDGSTDGSKRIILDYLKKHKVSNISLISYSSNKGKGYAVSRGVKHAKGDFIMFTDSDLAYSLDHLEILRDSLKLYDVVIGSRSLTNNSNNVRLARFVFGKGYNILSRMVLNLNYPDMQAGLKGFKKSIAKELFSKRKINGFAFDVEIIYLASKNHYSIGQIPAKITNPDSYKHTKVKLFRDSFKMFSSLLNIRLNSLSGKYEK